MFPSLRSKLIAAFAFVIVLSLVLSGSAAVLLLRQYQAELRLGQLAQVELPLMFQVRVLQRDHASLSQISDFLGAQASDLNVRILLTNQSGRIIADSGGGLLGQTIRSTGKNSPQPNRWFLTATYPTKSGHLVLVGERLRRPRELILDNPYYVYVAVPEESIGAAWMALAPSLSLAALVTLVASTIVAVFLARSIARPIMRVTAASEKMARGDFDQYIPSNGVDEVAQLGNSFNTMAHDVGTMHQTMRDFLANVSHELRTPLTSIQGFSQAIVDGTVGTMGECVDAAQIIAEESERMQHLVDDLLYLSKIESGQITMDKKRITLSAVLDDCTRILRPKLDAGGLQFDVDVAVAPPVVADKHRLEQVFVNLLDNAVKHTPAGGRVTVKAVAETKDHRPLGRGGVSTGRPHGWVKVAVNNTGSVIPAADIPRVFERFYQVDRARSGNSDGSGLGLAIVQEIVQAHDGRIDVESSATNGTTFTVYLPAA